MKEFPTLNALLTRRSIKLLAEPAPNAEELEAIFSSAMCAPDHGALRPWRFVLIRGKAKEQLLEISLSAIKKNDPTRMKPEKEASVRQWVANVPLLVGLAHQITYDDSKVPEQEQLLATGAAIMNVLNAVHCLGYGGFWSTSLGTYIEEVQNALGLDPLNYRFLGFLAIGTSIKEMAPVQRPNFSLFVTEWTG